MPQASSSHRRRDEFYVRYYVGHRGRFGHEFIEIVLHPDGLLEYTNDTDYKKDGQIKKEVFVNDIVMDQLKKIVLDSRIME